MVLTPEQMDIFFSNGFVVVSGIFSLAECHQASESIDRLVERSLHEQREEFIYTTDGRLKRVIWAGGLEHELLALGRDSKITSVVSQLLGSKNIVHLINQVHLKWAGDGNFYPLHQDSSNRRYGTGLWRDVNGRGSYVQSILAVEDVTAENGGLLFIPESCRRGHLGLPFVEGVQTRTSECHIEDAVPVSLRQGSMVFFGPYTIHGSLPNTNEHVQKLLINGYASPGANRREYLGCGKGEPLFVG